MYSIGLKPLSLLAHLFSADSRAFVDFS